MILVMILLLCLCFLLVRLLYERLWDKGLSCRLSFREEYAVEDDLATLAEVLINNKVLPLPVVEIDFHMDRRLQFADGQNSSVSDQSYRRDVFTLAVKQKITRTLEFKCAGRGYFRIDTAGVTAQDLFLTRSFHTSRPQSTEFYVLPRPVPPEKLDIPYARVMGAVLSRKKVYDDPFEFAGLREYSRGDPMKYINWKATARAGELLTNLHESTLSQRVTVLIDMEGRGVQRADRLNEDAVRIACSLSERLLKTGVELNLYSNGKDVLTGRDWKLESIAGAGSKLFLEKKFACLQAENGLPPISACLPGGKTEKGREREEDLVVLVSRSQRPDAIEAFAAALGKGHGVYILPYLAEKDELPAPKNIDLCWVEV